MADFGALYIEAWREFIEINRAIKNAQNGINFHGVVTTPITVTGGTFTKNTAFTSGNDNYDSGVGNALTIKTNSVLTTVVTGVKFERNNSAWNNIGALVIASSDGSLT
jgi:hypothetical protein